MSADDGHVLWASDTSNRALADIFLIQDEIAQNTTRALRLDLAPEARQRLARRYTENVEAYQLYLQGRYVWVNNKNEEALKKAAGYFAQAIEKDPNYALAYAGLADCYSSDLWFTQLAPEEPLAKAKRSAARALQLDDSLPEAHIAMSRAYYADWNWASGAKEIERAVQLSPGAGYAHHEYAYSLYNGGRMDEAVAEIKRSQELDPTSAVPNIDVGEILLYARRYDEAIQALKSALEMDPKQGFAHYDLGLAYEQKGMYQEAVTEFLEAWTLGGECPPEAIAALRQAYAASGIKAFWEKYLETQQAKLKRTYISPVSIARIYARLNQRDEAFRWLEKAYTEHSPMVSHILTPEFDSLRSDPRFVDLVKRVGLPAA